MLCVNRSFGPNCCPTLLAGLGLTPKMPAALPAPTAPHTASDLPRLHGRAQHHYPVYPQAFRPHVRGLGYNQYADEIEDVEGMVAYPDDEIAGED